MKNLKIATYFEIWSANIKFQFSDKDIFPMRIFFSRWISLKSVAETVIIDELRKKFQKLTYKKKIMNILIPADCGVLLYELELIS